MPHVPRLNLMTHAIVLLLLSQNASAYDGVCRTASDIDNLQPGQWCQTNTNTIADVLPNPSPPGGIPVSGIMAWSSGAYDTKRNRLLVWGGGDWDYGGNEIYAFDIDGDPDLNQSPMTWKRIWGPTDVSMIPVVAGFYEAYPDGNPGSRHTYDGFEYLPNLDILWASGGSLWASGWGSHYTWFFDSTSRRWDRKSDRVYASLEDVAAYDPSTGHVFMNSYGTFYEYNPFSDVWTVRGGFSAGYPGHANAEIDPVRRRFLIVGASSWPGSGSVSFFDLNETGNGLQLHPQPTSGDNSITSERHPGLAYDTSNNQFVAWGGVSGRTANVFTLNPTTWAWREVAPAPTNLTVPTGPFSTGTFGRFRYIPSKNVFVLVNGTNQQVYFYKLSTGSGAPADSVAPAAPIDLRTR